jgi:2-polyprenyl-3-methyl-5-hydroxy-6-metoxy-1,4-benzoquinol methylase
MSKRSLLPRRVAPEALDALDAGDPAARRSRRDLRRLHVAMGTLSIMTRAIGAEPDRSPLRILEIGAGDGSLALRFARKHARRLPLVSWTLLDRQDTVDAATLRGLQQTGWSATVAVADVFDWLGRSRHGPWDIIVANLFIHHFDGKDLSRLLNAVAGATRLFFCCEPRRSATALIGSHLVGLIGAGPVTREDAVLSVHAGFRDRELSAHWPRGGGWSLREYPAGLFSHCLLARRI